MTMTKLVISVICGLLLYGCTHLKKGDIEFTHMGTAACTFQTIKGQPIVIIAEDDVVSDVVKILIDKGLLK